MIETWGYPSEHKLLLFEAFNTIQLHSKVETLPQTEVIKW